MTPRAEAMVREEIETRVCRAPTVAPASPVRVPVRFALREPSVTVILPVFNESGLVDSTIDQIAAFAGSRDRYRFIFVDDGSSDGTAARLNARIAALRRSGASVSIEVIGYRVNAGKGHAVGRGVAAADGDDDDLIIFTDGDLAYSLDHVPRMVRALEDADVVIGSRRGPQGGYRASPVRNAMGWVYNRMARACIGASYRDTQAGLKGFRLGAARRIFSALRVTGFAFDVEVLFLARRFGYRIAEIPATVAAAHPNKPSSVNLLRDPRRMFVSLAGIRVSAALGQYERPAEGRRPLALLSFDAEEFDLPGEFGRPIDGQAQLDIAGEGMRRALRLLCEVPARATFFSTARFAEAHPDLIRAAVASGHEIASHGVTHTGFVDADLAESRRVLERIAGVAVRGFRRPRFAPTSPACLLHAGYSYDSSINPIWLPGRYNNLAKPRHAFAQGDVVQIPTSTTPLVRFPLFWLAFKNTPPWAFRIATRWAMSADGYAALCFHPWELCDLQRFGIPWYVRRVDDSSMQSRLIRYLRWLSRRAAFATYSQLDRSFREGSWPFPRPTDDSGGLRS